MGEDVYSNVSSKDRIHERDDCDFPITHAKLLIFVDRDDGTFM